MGAGRVRKWTVLPAGAGSTSWLAALALAGLETGQIRYAERQCRVRLARLLDRPVEIEVVQVRHAPQERQSTTPSRRQVGWRIEADGRFGPLSRSAMQHQDPAVPAGSPETRNPHEGRLLVGRGCRDEPHEGTDSFDIPHDQRLRRCAGLLGIPARLTDPVAFLQRLHQKGRYRAGRARGLLVRLSADFRAWLGWEVKDRLGPTGDFEACWRATPPGVRKPLTLVLDIARHQYDVSAHSEDPDPLQQPGVVLLDRPDDGCSAGCQTRFFELLNRCFPRLQFFVGLSAAARRRFPAGLLNEAHPIPEPLPRPHRPRVRPLPPGTTLLVDVDGTLPNLALMKLSRDLKERGRKVTLVRGFRALPVCGTVLASCIFNRPSSAARLRILEKTYGNDLRTGGSGVDLRLRLSPEIEALAPDYSLYPELEDRALGFLTRGCPQRCSFCVVPVKEGAPYQASDLDTLLQGRRKLILLDDNLLAHPAALELLEEMVRRELAVNFNQTLDLRRLTGESAGLLRRIRCSNVGFTRRVHHFSLNDARGLERLRERYALLGTTCRDNVEFVCMYGFNTSLAEDVERFRFLRSLRGAYVFVQRYQPVPGGPDPDLDRLFDDRADALLDELVRIVFPQNMKSMETYYRWLAIQYATRCGRIHQRLIETLFRFNDRSRMGNFVERLKGLARAAP